MDFVGFKKCEWLAGCCRTAFAGFIAEAATESWPKAGETEG